MRAVEDDHVDRPEVQARQRAELTGTNRPIDLIVSRDPSPPYPIPAGSAPIRTGSAKRSQTDQRQQRLSPTLLAEQNGAPAVAAPCDSESPKTTCAWPVWWPERCAQNPIPSRTRPLNTPAPMVLCLKTRESRSPPDPPNTGHTTPPRHDLRRTKKPLPRGGGFFALRVTDPSCGGKPPARGSARDCALTERGGGLCPRRSAHRQGDGSIRQRPRQGRTGERLPPGLLSAGRPPRRTATGGG